LREIDGLAERLRLPGGCQDSGCSILPQAYRMPPCPRERLNRACN